MISENNHGMIVGACQAGVSGTDTDFNLHRMVQRTKNLVPSPPPKKHKTCGQHKNNTFPYVKKPNVSMFLRIFPLNITPPLHKTLLRNVYYNE